MVTDNREIHEIDHFVITRCVSLLPSCSFFHTKFEEINWKLTDSS